MHTSKCSRQAPYFLNFHETHATLSSGSTFASSLSSGNTLKSRLRCRFWWIQKVSSYSDSLQLASDRTKFPSMQVPHHAGKKLWTHILVGSNATGRWRWFDPMKKNVVHKLHQLSRVIMNIQGNTKIKIQYKRNISAIKKSSAQQLQWPTIIWQWRKEERSEP